MKNNKVKSIINVIILGIILILVIVQNSHAWFTPNPSTITSNGRCGSHYDYMALDENVATYWDGCAGPAWLKMDLGASVTQAVNALRIYVCQNGVKTIYVRGSNDDSNYTLLHTVNRASDPTEAWNEWNFSNQTVYRYILLDFPDSNTSEVIVNELQLAYYIPPVMTGLTLTPSGVQIYVGGTRQYTAYATYDNGSTSNITSQCSWVITDGGTATVLNGLVTGVNTGECTITATYLEFSANQTFTVIANPGGDPGQGGGGGSTVSNFYSDWTGETYSNYEEYAAHSTIRLFGDTDIVMSKKDFMLTSGIFGALLSCMMIGALYRAVL